MVNHNVATRVSQYICMTVWMGDVTNQSEGIYHHSLKLMANKRVCGLYM